MALHTNDIAILQMALVGYQMEKDDIELKIREIQAELRGTKVAAAPAPGAKGLPRKRKMSSAGRARIAAAQKKRWADYHRRVAAEAG